MVLRLDTAGWVERETTRLATDRPRTFAVLSWLWKRPAAVLVPLAVLGAVAVNAGGDGGDGDLFRTAGLAMLRGNPLNVFSDPTLQIGPLYLLMVGAVSVVAEALGVSAMLLTCAVEATGLILLTLLATRSAIRTMLPGRADEAAQWAVGATMILGGTLFNALVFGHPEELAVGLLLGIAAFQARRGQAGRAGLLVGLATGLKVWALTGAAVVLLARRPRAVLLGVVLAATVVLVTYGPFLLWGDTRTFDFRWSAQLAGPFTWLVAATGWSDWTVRLVQGAAAGTAGALVALRARSHPLSTPIAAVAVRLLLDPLRIDYYWSPLIVLLIVWVWSHPADAVRRWRAPSLMLAPLFVVAPSIVSPASLSLVGSVLLVAVVALVWVGDGGHAQPVTSYTAAVPPESTRRTPFAGADRRSI